MSAAVLLVGPRGAGKTTLGRLLAGHLDWDFEDADRLLEERHGRRIADWLPLDPAGFRAAESALLGELLGREDCVVALGGGVVEDPANVDRLAAHDRVLALRASTARLVARQRGAPRPALTQLPLEQEVERLLASRVEAYDRAARGRWVETDGGVDDAFRRLLEAVGRIGCLNC